MVAIVDLLEVPHDRKVVHDTIWSGLVAQLDVGGMLGSDRSVLVGDLFSDRFDVAKRQELFGLALSSEAYNLKLNGLVAELKGNFADTFNMVDDFVKNLDLLLKHGFVEANNRVDEYSEAVDAVKITNYGTYTVSELAFNFTYLDLVCTDCGIFAETVSNYLVEAARKEYGFFTKGQRMQRVEIRIDRVQQFIDYLAKEEQRERDIYSLGMPESEMFTYKCRATFEAEQVRVLASARKQGHTGKMTR